MAGVGGLAAFALGRDSVPETSMMVMIMIESIVARVVSEFFMKRVSREIGRITNVLLYGIFETRNIRT